MLKSLQHFWIERFGDVGACRGHEHFFGCLSCWSPQKFCNTVLKCVRTRRKMPCWAYDSQTPKDCGCWFPLTHTWFHLPFHHPSPPSIIRLGCSQEKYICQVDLKEKKEHFVVPRGGSSGSSDLLAGFTSPLPHLITNCWEQVNTKSLIDIIFMDFHHSVWLRGGAGLSRNRVVGRHINGGEKEKFVFSCNSAFPQVEGYLSFLFPTNS